MTRTYTSSSSEGRRCRNPRCEDLLEGLWFPLCWACRGAWLMGVGTGPLLAGLAGAAYYLVQRFVQ